MRTSSVETVHARYYPMDKKKRSRNFSSRDRYLLADFMKAVVKIIENKRHDGSVVPYCSR